MKSKFDSLYAKILTEDVNGKFDFEKTKLTGPEHMLEVTKADVYAYQLATEDDLKAVANYNPPEGPYKAGVKVIGSWLCMADVPLEAGRYWIVKDDKFKTIYESKKPMDNQTKTEGANVFQCAVEKEEIVNGSKTIKKEEIAKDFTFAHYKAKPATYNCFRLPDTFPESKSVWGQEFHKGGYVFVNADGTCDIYERTAIYMNAQYNFKKDLGPAPVKAQHQYMIDLLGNK